MSTPKTAASATSAPKKPRAPRYEVKLTHAESHGTMRIRAREKNGAVTMSVTTTGRAGGDPKGKRLSAKGASQSFKTLDEAKPAVDALAQKAVKLGWAFREKRASGEGKPRADAFDANNLPNPKQVLEAATKRAAEKAAKKAEKAAKAPAPAPAKK